MKATESFDGKARKKILSFINKNCAGSHIVIVKD